MSLVLCFSGQIGSGKSSVSTQVAQSLGWNRTSFGDYLRAETVRRGGDPGDRKSLQDLGQALVDADSATFCWNVLVAGGFKPGENFVVDGIRHVSIFNNLARVSRPSEAKLLFLSAGNVTRNARVRSRADAGDFTRASAHQVEAELNRALPDRAEEVVDANQPMDCVLAECLELVRRWRVYR